ncbi:36571_t:CDS:2, partial [Gigaspora margarita]
MSGHNIESDYVESLNDDYSDVKSDNSENSEVSNSDFTDFSFLFSQQHFLVRSETLRVFISLSLARYIISWYRANDIYSLILNNMVHLICAENGLDLSASSFSWVVFSDNSLVDLDFQTVVEAYGYNSSHEDFSLKTFLKQEIIFLDLSSGPDHSPDVPEEPGYREWIASPDLNLSPIEVEIFDFFKGYSSDDSDGSMVIESDKIFCEYFDDQNDVDSDFDY